ncbi:hypothetical protein M758_UG154700 [Ceratodon purpureus]|nr:hypothetical protein M758_UG154700 [Ceratodon purpureus]
MVTFSAPARNLIVPLLCRRSLSVLARISCVSISCVSISLPRLRWSLPPCRGCVPVLRRTLSLVNCRVRNGRVAAGVVELGVGGCRAWCEGAVACGRGFLCPIQQHFQVARREFLRRAHLDWRYRSIVVSRIRV